MSENDNFLPPSEKSLEKGSEPEGYEFEGVAPQPSKYCCGTTSNVRLWFNTTDVIGVVFAIIAWAFILFGYATVVLLYLNAELSQLAFGFISVFTFLSLWSHCGTMFFDPGSVPWNAHPTSADRKAGVKMVICGHCDSYKPPMAHHDRVSGRCITRMDHFCPWMNNAIGARNQKNFILFLAYTAITSMIIYGVLAVNLVNDVYTGTGLVLARVLIFLTVFSILFTSSMFVNQLYGINLGLGTIDRMKEKNLGNVVPKPIPFRSIFGVFGLRWILPLVPHFDNGREVYRYSVKNYRYGKEA